MPLRPTPFLAAIAVVALSCHPEIRSQRCNPYRTPRLLTAPVAKGEEKSAHAPWLAGDCMVCHVRTAAAAGETEEEAQQHLGLLRNINERCVSCHKELFRRPPNGHPPEEAFCASCHAPHLSRNASLLRDDDVSHACLDYAPPIPQKPPPKLAVPVKVRGL